MNIDIASDLHLEFSPSILPETCRFKGGDILIIPGDAVVVKQLETFPVYYVFFERVSALYKHVIVIMGNHEFYDHYFKSAHERYKKWLTRFDNVHLLQNDAIDIEGLSIFGSTFWTDIRGNDPLICQRVQYGLRDYDRIKYSKTDNGHGYKLRPFDTIRENAIARVELREFLRTSTPGKRIVVTHHALFEHCTPSVYRQDDLRWAYVNTGMDDILYDYDGPNETIFIHGHLHNRSVENIESNTLIVNAHGYVGYEDVESFEPLRISV